MNKAGGNWVEGDAFFDREVELATLTERVKEGTHTLLTAQRRMGKTSLVRELLRRLNNEGAFKTVFVDLEAAASPADAIAEIVSQPGAALGMRKKAKHIFAIALKDREVSGGALGATLRTLRSAVNAGNWQHMGDQVFTALAHNGPTVLALDELPILVNRLLKGDDYTITPERKRATDDFLGWLRKNGQEHRGKISLILSGSVSLEPILQQAGLSAQVNIFSPYDLKPWDAKTASECLGALAKSYDLHLPQDVRQEMCRRLRCQIPHHVQRFFDVLHEDLRRTGRDVASLKDVQRVYEGEMLGLHGQAVMETYVSRLKVVLGDEAWQVARGMLTEAADDGLLSEDAVMQHRQAAEANRASIEDVLHVLEHDGYLERRSGGYRFISGLLEDWWRTRYGKSRASASPAASRAPSIKP